MPHSPYKNDAKGFLIGLKRFGGLTAEGFAVLNELGLSGSKNKLAKEIAARPTELMGLMRESIDEETVEYLSQDPSLRRLLPIAMGEIGGHAADIGGAGVGLFRLGKMGAHRLGSMAAKSGDGISGLAMHAPWEEMAPKAIASVLRKNDVPESQIESILGLRRQEARLTLKQQKEQARAFTPPGDAGFQPPFDPYGQIRPDEGFVPRPDPTAIPQTPGAPGELRGLRAAQELPEMKGGLFARKRAERAQAKLAEEIELKGSSIVDKIDDNTSRIFDIQNEMEGLNEQMTLVEEQIFKYENFPKERDKYVSKLRGLGNKLMELFEESSKLQARNNEAFGFLGVGK